MCTFVTNICSPLYEHILDRTGLNRALYEAMLTTPSKALNFLYIVILQSADTNILKTLDR